MTIFKTFTDAEKRALRLHGLDINQPSQLSDAFVHGMRHARPASPTQTYIQEVPDHCDRIIWRRHYYHLPLSVAAGGEGQKR